MMTYIFIGIAIFAAIILVVLMIPSSNKKEEQKQRYSFELEAGNGKRITFGNPFNNFLVYAGAEGGKTKSIGKPLLREYIKYHFAGMIYDYKDFDLTKTAYNLTKKANYPYKFYYISFTDMEHTYRTNPIAPAIVEDDSLFLQLLGDFFAAYMEKDAKKDEWFGGALGILRGVGIRFYHDFPQFCTIPHIVNFICQAGAAKITEFLNSSIQSRALAKGFLDAADSPKTQASFLSSLTRSLGILANDKKICYVLSGNDFSFNLIDPEEPKLVAIANSYQVESLISPVISLMLSISSRRFTLKNKIPFFYFLDEATTFKIEEFEKMPSVLREYLCSFTLLTQSAAKIEKLYGRLDRSSIEANFSNQFYGRTKDIEALKSYPLVFGKAEKQRISRTTGSSRGADSRSKTVSLQKEEVYDTSFFTNLKSGEFVGSAAHSNMPTFHLRFKMYDEPEEPLPIVHTVLRSEIEQCYLQIIDDVSKL